MSLALECGGFLRALSGPWVIYTKLPPLSGGEEERWSLRLDTGAQFKLNDMGAGGTDIAFLGADRALLKTDFDIYSVTLTGANKIVYASLSGQESLQGLLLEGLPVIIDNSVVS